LADDHRPEGTTGRSVGALQDLIKNLSREYLLKELELDLILRS